MPTGTIPLFRYVAVRPVQTRDLLREKFRFLRSPEVLTAFRERLKSTAGWDAARKTAQTFINSESWLGGHLETDPRLVGLRAAYRAMQEAVASGENTDLRARVRQIVENAVKPEALPGLNNDLWDSLIATYAAPRPRARDRAGLIDCLRALHYIQHPQIDSAEDLHDVVQATAMVPDWIGSGPNTVSGTHPPQTVPAEPGTVIPGTVPIGTIRDLRRQVVQIDIACDDLEVAYANARREARKKKPVPKSPQSPAAKPGGSRVPPQIYDRPSEPIWANTVIEREKLERTTTAILDGIDLVWEDRSQDEALEKLQARRSSLTNKLRRLGGSAALSELEARTLPVDRPDIAIDEFEFPIDLPPLNVFTGSIEGSVGEIRPVGVGDLLIVQETLLGYEDGEIATIENVMSTESKNRTFRKLDRTTTTTFTSTETTETTERDLQSTQRYEMQSETSETITNEVAIDTGINISASYGPMVQVDASADFSVDNTTENSTTTASNFAQDIVDKSVSKLTQSLKEEITLKVLSETEETSAHGFENDTGAHIIGVYRWLNKLYQAQVHNYGKRMLIEFKVPEPAAFHKHAKKFGISSDPTLQPPEPLEESLTFTDIEPNNYNDWVGRYHVDNVTPAPMKSKIVSKGIDIPQALDQGGLDVITRSDSLVIPTGYVAKEAWVNSNGLSTPGGVLWIGVGQNWVEGDDYVELDDEETSVPLGVVGLGFSSAVIIFEVRCERTDETLKAWKLETFQKIVDAYDALQAEYEANVKAREASQLSAFTGIPPEAKRTIELTELKKGCLELLTNQYFYDFDATVANASPFGYPEFETEEGMGEGSYAQFFEQCFEWENATWVYYPYFWGRKDQWIENSTATDSDPIFESFLRAGMARVQVPVRPGYGKTLLYYLHTGEIWNGGEPPVLDNPLYVSLVEEIAESQDTSLADAPVYGDPWIYSLPTTLVKLQSDATLPSWPAP